MLIIFLLDTQIVIWAVGESARLPAAARAILEDPGARVAFSLISIWEVAIKNGLGRASFRADPRRLRSALIAADYTEVAVTSEHALAITRLPPLHKDPFDRMLIAQADAEGLTLLTADATMARYPGPIRLVT